MRIFIWSYFLVCYFVVLPVLNHTFASSVQWSKSNGIESYSQDIRISRNDENIIFATLRANDLSGLYRSNDKGVNFYPILPLQSSRDINSIATSQKNSAEIWVNSYEHGIYYSKDGGSNWIQPENNIISAGRYLEIDPINDAYLIAGTGSNNSDGGIYKSTDGGKNWQQIGRTTYGNKNNLNLFIDPHDNNIIYAGSDWNIYKSSNGGETWVPLSILNSVLPGTLVDTIDSNIIYSATTQSKLFKSNDSGGTWTSLSNIEGKTIFRLVQDSNRFLYASTLNYGGVWLSVDEGNSWENIGDPEWGARSTWGLDIKNGRIYVSVEGLGLYYADLIKPNKKPIVLIPGFLGSWSHKGLIENQETNQEDWNLIPIFSKFYYQPFLETLKSAGYTENKDLYTFAYDYRKSAADSGADLNKYLEKVVNDNSGLKVDIVAHSMGGIVVRYCYEKVSGCSDKIDKIITAGSPHQGVVKTYSLWEGGVVEDSDLLGKILEVILKTTYRSEKTSKDIIQNHFPGVKDLLPIFDYLNGKPYALMSITGKNQLLDSLKVPSNGLLNKTTTLDGTGISTLSGFDITSPGKSEKILGVWTDGKPVKNNFEDGDGTVLRNSAFLQNSSVNTDVKIEHKNYLNSQESLEKILGFLGIDAKPVTYENNLQSILIILVHSPISVKLKNQNGELIGESPDSGKSVFLANPSDGQYDLEIIQNGNGVYGIDGFLINNSGIKQTIIAGVAEKGKTIDQKIILGNDNISIHDPFGQITLVSLKTSLGQISNPDIQKLLKKINLITNLELPKFLDKEKINILESYYDDLFRILARESRPLERNGIFSASEIFLNYLLLQNPGSNIVISRYKLQTMEQLLKIIDAASPANQIKALNLILAEKQLEAYKSAAAANEIYKANLLFSTVYPLIQN